MITFLVNFFENHFISCYFYNTFGVQCPGCGFQRSLIALLKGNFIESFYMYPPLLPVILTILYLIMHLFLKLKNGAKILKYMFIITILCIGANYIYKIIIGNIW